MTAPRIRSIDATRDVAVIGAAGVGAAKGALMTRTWLMTAWPASTLPRMIRTALGSLPRDGRLLLLTRFIRLFAYGALSVVLVLYLTALNLNAAQVGLLMTLTLVGDTIVSFWLSTHADRIGRRRMLILGAGLMAAA